MESRSRNVGAKHVLHFLGSIHCSQTLFNDVSISLFGRLVHSGRSQGGRENKLRCLFASSSHHLRNQMWVAVKVFRHVVVLGVWDLISWFLEFTPWQKKKTTFDEHMKPFWHKKKLVPNQNPEKRLHKTLR